MAQHEINADQLAAKQIALGLDDDEFADHIDVTTRTLGNWRSGATRPGWKTIVRIARVLGVEPKELIKQPVAEGVSP